MKNRLNQTITRTIAVVGFLAATTAGAVTPVEPTQGWPYAGAQAVAVDSIRDLLFLGSGGVILVLDVTDPAAPQLVYDGLPTAGHVRDLLYDAPNQRLFVADWRGGLEIWDVKIPQQPEQLSATLVYYVGTDSDQPTDGLSLVGDTLFINANEARVHAFDVSDAENPIDLGVQAGPTWYYTYERDTDAVAAADGYVYVGGSGLAKYEILPNGTLDKVGENTYDGVRCLGAQGSVVFAGNSQGLDIYDTSSPYPTIVGSVAVADGLNDLVLTEGSVVAVNGSGLLVFDVTTPAAPTQIGSLELPDGYRLQVNGDTAYVAGDAAGLQVVNLVDPSDPALIGTYDTVGTTWAATVAGDTAFLGQGSDGVVITDVSDPDDVQMIGRAGGGTSSNESVLIGQHLYVADWYAPSVRVFDVSDLTEPVEVGSIEGFTAADLATDGEHLFAMRFSVDTQLHTLYIFGLSDPAVPVELSSMTVSQYILEMEYGNDHLFAVEFYDAGVHIINVADPYDPYEAAFYPTDWGEDVWVQGNLAYITAFHEGLIVLDIQDPANPTVAGSFYEIYQFDSVAVSNGLAFITTGSTGEHHLRVYDVSDLGAIAEIDRFPLPGNAWNLAASDGSAYVADGITGLQIFRGPSTATDMIFADGFEPGDMSNWSVIAQ